MGLRMLHFEFLLGKDLEAMDAAENILFACLDPAVNAGKDLFVVYAFGGEQVAHDRGR